MVEMSEKDAIRIAAAITALVLIATPALIFSIRPPGISRMPAQEIYSQGIALNYYINNVLPIVIVLAILFIAGLSTFGLYHGATRETLGKRPLIHRPLAYIRERRKTP